MSVLAMDGGNASNTSIQILATRLERGAITAGQYSTSRSLQIPLGPGSFTTARELTTTVMQNNQSWTAPATGGSGTVTISSITSTHVEGTFTFVGALGAGSTRSASGSFRARLADERVC